VSASILAISALLTAPKAVIRPPRAQQINIHPDEWSSAAIGAIGGILVTPITLTNYDVGTLLALKGFAAAMLGGMGNPLGAVVGGLIVGLLEAFGAGYISSQYKDAIAFLVILGVLFAMPQGLFGRAGVERV
jgi:branched-chain amino acid transport system permease protein